MNNLSTSCTLTRVLVDKIVKQTYCLGNHYLETRNIFVPIKDREWMRARKIKFHDLLAQRIADKICYHLPKLHKFERYHSNVNWIKIDEYGLDVGDYFGGPQQAL